MEIKEMVKGMSKISIKYDILWTEEIKNQLMVAAKAKGGSLTVDDINRTFTLLIAMMKTEL